METIILGSTGIAATRSGFGALPIQRLSKEEAARLLVLAYEGGINFFDTAIGYQSGTSEQYLGRALREAAAIDPEGRDEIPSTKGML